MNPEGLRFFDESILGLANLTNLELNFSEYITLKICIANIFQNRWQNITNESLQYLATSILHIPSLTLLNLNLRE